MYELQLSDDINVITAEINAYQRMVGEAIFEIGRRLKHVKEKDLAHGEFGKWLKEVGLDRRRASEFIKVFVEFKDSNVRTYGHLGLNALYEIATLPPEQRKILHKVSTTGKMKRVDEMTVKELKKLKNDLKDAEDKNNQLRKSLEREKQKRDLIESKVIEKEVDRTDYEEIKRLQNELDTVQKKLESESRQRESYEEWATMNEKDAKEYRKLKNEIEFLYSKKDGQYRQIESIKQIGGLLVEIEHLLSDKLAPIKYSRAIQEQRNEELVVKNLEEIIDRVENWTKEMRRFLPKNNIIDVEAI